jgi:hypothetical protein
MPFEVDDLVNAFAVKLRRKFRLVDIEDLIQLGHCVVLEARRTFEPMYGTKFSTYAWLALQRELTKYCIQTTSPASGDLTHGSQWAREVSRVDVDVMHISNSDSPFRFSGNQDELLDRARVYKRIHEIMDQSPISEVMKEHMLEGNKFSTDLPRKEITTEVTRIRKEIKEDRLISEYYN